METMIRYPESAEPSELQRRTFIQSSPIGDHRTEVLLFEPLATIGAYVFLIHDISDNKLRYESFAETLAGYGHAVILFDLRGHGESPADGHYGYFAANEGWERQIRDIEAIVNRYAQPTKPVIILGCGIGAGFALALLKRYPSLVDGMILLGPYAPWPAPGLTRITTGIVSFFDPVGRGTAYQKMILEKLSARFAETRTSFDWLSSIPEEVDAYLATEHCGEALSKRAYHDLSWLQNDVFATEGWQVTQRRLPIQIRYGGFDPGENLSPQDGERLRKHLRGVGYLETNLKYYAHSRHALLFDREAAEVFNEIRDFCGKLSSALPRK